RIESTGSMRFISVFLLIFAVQPFCPLSQSARIEQAKDPSYELWRVRSQALTGDLLKDATQLSSSRRAVLWARLGQRWWRDDPRKATTWITNAIELIEPVPNMEKPDERRQRLQTARRLLQFVAPLDQQLSKRLITVLTKDRGSSS